MYSQTNIRGMNAIVLRRSSSAGQGTSITNQGRTVDSVIQEYDLTVIHEFVLECITGSIPGNRSDIDEILAEKQKHAGQPLLLLVPDHTRFTRAGAGHGGSLLYKLRANSILVYFVAEDVLVENDLTLQLAIMLLAAAHQTAKSIGRSSTLGSDLSFLHERSPHTRRPPFGLDRMYYVDGKPAHIIRNLPDGTQQMLEPDTGELKRTFGVNPKRGIPAHYIKQKNETVSLCLGAEAAVATVRLIFEMRYVQLMKYRQIARKLNDNGVGSPNGREWSSLTIKNLLLNPIYVGLAVRYRTTRGIYVQGGSPNGEPEPSQVTPEELDKQSRVTIRRRKREKWKERPARQFDDFLPENVREAAKAAIEGHLESLADARPPKPRSRDPHTHSQYLLKNLLRCKKTGHPLTGRQSGKPGHVIRKYAVSKGSHIPRSSKQPSKRISAEPIETAVMTVLREVLLNQPKLKEAIKSAVAHARKQQSTDPNNTAEMQKQIKRLRKRIALLSDQISDDDSEGNDDPIVQKIHNAKTEIRHLTVALQRAGEKISPKPIDVESNIDQLVKNFADFGRRIDPADVPLIRSTLELLISRLEVDLDTQEFEIELSLPSWMGIFIQNSPSAGLQAMTAWRTCIETHPENRVILGKFLCDAREKPICYTCQRLRLAA